MSAESQTVPNSGLVTFAKFDITAGSEDAAISSIQLEREGLSNRSDIDRVYFEQNSKRISSRGSVNIDDEVMVSFTPAMVVEAGTTETIDLVVQLTSDDPNTANIDESATVGAEHRFAIIDVESSTDVANNLPIVTNTMKLGSYTVETVTFDPTDLTGVNEINVGDTDVLMGEFELETNGDKDNLFKSVTFTNNGGADLEQVFANIGLYNDGVNVATDVMVDGRDITFIVNHEIENGMTELYEIRADLVSTERNEDEVELELRNSTDLNVVELDTDFSAPIEFSVNGQIMTEYTLIGGELLLTRDTEYTNTDTVSSSTNDVVLLAANLKVDEAITVEDLTMGYTTNYNAVDTEYSLYDQYRDLKLVVDGRTISTYTPGSNDDNTANGDIQFDGTFLVENDSSIMVLGNLKNDVEGNAEFKIDNFSLEVGTTARDIRYVSNDERVNSIPGSVNAINVTVADASLLVTRNDGLNSETLVAGSRDVELFGFSMRANDVSDLRVTSIKPSVTYTSEEVTAGGLTVNSVDTTDATITIDVSEIDNLGNGATLTSAVNGNDLVLTVVNDTDASNGGANADYITVAELANEVNTNLAGFTASVDTAGNAVAVAQTELNEVISETNVTNVRLYEGNTLLKTENDFDFNSLDINIPKNGAKSFKIVADFDTSVGNNAKMTLNLDDSNEVSVRNVESNTLLTNATINGVSSTDFTFKSQGTLAITSNSDSRDSSIVTPSNTEVDVFTFDLEASDDELRLTDLYVSEVAGNDTLDLTNSIQSASIRVDGRTIDGAVVSNDTLYFPIGNSNPVLLEQDEVVSVDVLVSFSDSTSRPSADFQFEISNGGYAGTVNGEANGMRLISDSTGLEVTAPVSAVTSDVHLYSRGSVVATTGTATQSTQEFSIAADSNRRVLLNTIEFDYTGENPGADSSDATTDTIDNFEMKKSNSVITGTFTYSAGKLLFTYTTPEYLDAGTEQDFTIEMPGLSNLGAATWTREMRVSDITFDNDVNAPVTVNAGNYDNTGLPTDYASVEYVK